ncbi:MAG: hypothetical protein WKG32_21915 [Gemmatimonadaceae bacterium]
MKLGRRLSFLAVIAAISFAFAYMSGRWREPAAGQTATIPRTAPDSVKLAAQGIVPGRQLIAYAVVSSRCGFCQRPDTKAALAALRAAQKRSNSGSFARTSVVGIAIDPDIAKGLGYLDGVGRGSFDEISVGRGWVNEHLGTLVWRDSAGVAAVPQVIVVARDLSAVLRPRMSVRIGRDSVLMRLVGYKAVVEWVQGGARVANATTELSAAANRPARSAAGPSDGRSH